MSEKSINPLFRASLYLLGTVIPVVAGYYLLRWLEEDVDLKYHHSTSLQAKVGMSRIEKDMLLEVSHITYKEKTYEGLRLERFFVVNNSALNLKKEAKFVFIRDGKDSIPSGAIVDLTFESHSSTSDFVVVKRMDINDVGPGFEIVSDLPGLSKIQVSLVLDINSFPEIKDAKVDLRKIARSGEKLTPDVIVDSTITISTLNLLIWILISAALYGGAWLLINICLKNYSTGAKIVDWIIRKLLGRDKGFIKR